MRDMKFQLFYESSAQFKIPPKLTKNYKIVGDLGNVKEWKAKIVLGNSVSKDQHVGDWDDVGYVGISLDSNIIVPISHGDEHQNGYELLGTFIKKRLIPDEDYYTVHWGNNYTGHYVGDPEMYFNRSKEAYKRWLSYGGKNASVEVEIGGRNYQGYMSDIVKINSYFDVNAMIGKSGVLAPHGKQLVNDLEAIARQTVIVNKTENPEDIEKLNNMALSFIEDYRWELNSFIEGLDKIKETIEKNFETYNNTEQLFFSMNGIKNKLHMAIRNAISRKSIDRYDIESLIKAFGDLDLANKEFNRLGDI